MLDSPEKPLSRSIHNAWPFRPAKPRRRRRVLLAAAALLATLLLITGVDRRAASPAAGRFQDTRKQFLFKDVLRIATFNMHGGIGRDGRFNLNRIVDCVRGCDIIALNEVRRGGLFGSDNQASALAAKLKINSVFAPSESQWWHGHFGNGLLFNVPALEWRSISLVGTRGKAYRNMVLADVPWQSAVLHILLTHIDREIDRTTQMETVIEQFRGTPSPRNLARRFEFANRRAADRTVTSRARCCQRDR